MIKTRTALLCLIPAAVTACAVGESPLVAALSSAISSECVVNEDGLSGACFTRTATGTIVSDYVVTGTHVFFETGSYDLSPEAKRTLRRQADWLLEHPTETARLEGVTDTSETPPGSREAFLLGERRAGAVRDYLVAAGVAPERIVVQSLGGLRAADPRSSEAANALNRSVPTVIVGVHASTFNYAIE